MSDGIIPIRMPKWGLSMQEGQLVAWLKAPGERFSEGEELAEVETSKINNVYEAPASGLLRRQIVAEGETAPVGALLAVAAEPEVTDDQIDAFVEAFQSAFVPEDAGSEAGGGLQLLTVQVDGRDINVGTAGEGLAPVVLIHGFTGDLNAWALTLEPLAARGRVVALDLPGHGASSKEVRGGTLDELGEAVTGALNALGVSSADLVGHSLGGAVALRLAQRHPDRFRTLTLVAPAGLPGIQVNRQFVDGMVEAQRPRDLKPLLEMLFADPQLVSAEMVEAMARYKRIDGVEEALSAIRDQLVTEASYEALRAELPDAPPTLLVLGREDRIVGQPELAALPHGWQVVVLDGVGHMPQLEAAGAFNEHLLKFLNETP